MRQKHGVSRRLLAALAAVVAFGCLLAAPQGAKATLIGDTFTLESDTAFGFFTDTATVGPGPEFVAGDMSSFSQALLRLRPNSAYFIDVDATGITFFWDFNHQFTYTFSGLDWTDMPGTITSVTGSTISGFGMITANVITGDTVEAQFDCILSGVGGEGCGPTTFTAGPPGSEFRVDITAVHTPVPEPATVTLFGVGLAMLGLMVMWRRRRQAA